ncbi:MAG: hypothetical protein IT249_17265 [Chitinophagaceae bacterium]|nr:hypothetical protein [Chitinophagaceae bacterium]
MFEHVFKTQLSLLSGNQKLIEKYWLEIVEHYSKNNRHYHNLTHLESLLLSLSPVQNEIADWQTIVFSIAYHDIIYNPLKTDNEKKSAELAHKRLSALSLPISKIDKCFAQIMATKMHSISDDEDTNFFTNADLAILGCGSEDYARYSRLIRKEYKIYPDFVYNPGRIKVLKHFLEMPRIYKTPYFYNKYEKQARMNMEWEMKNL